MNVHLTRFFEALFMTLAIITRSCYSLMWNSKQQTVSSIKYLFRHSNSLFCTSSSNNNGFSPSIDYSKYVWDLKGLKSETSRIYLRTFKKIAKCNEKLSSQSSDVDDGGVLKSELSKLQEYLSAVGNLETQLKEIRSATDKSFPTISQLAIKLEITDQPPPPQIRGPKKPSGSSRDAAPRKPYYPYKSLDDIIIRVGREAPDNDLLSTSPKLRDPNHWWLHVSGMPGSHVVIRNTSDSLSSLYPETLKDAALLAAVNSKASSQSSGKITVTYTRCRNVSKPSGAKAGLVYLSGDVSQININIKAEALRLERLLKTKGVYDEQDPVLYEY